MVGPRPIPKDTANALTSKSLAGCLNLGLLLDRLSPWERYIDGKRVLWDLTFRVREKKRGEWKQDSKRGGEAKGLWLSNRQDDYRTKLLDEPLLRQNHIDAALLKAHRARWERLVAHHGADAESGLRFDLQTESRLVVGLGSDSVLETAVTLHRIYGFPIIPGSALKGLTRIWALLELADVLGVPALGYEQFQAYKGPKVKNKRKTPLNRLEALLETDLDTKDPKLQNALQNDLDALKHEQQVVDADGDILKMDLNNFTNQSQVQDFRTVFGYLGQAGSSIFFDAIPINVPQLVADVMNVHYPDYYRDESGDTPPSDDQDPNPVSFLAVDEGNTFCFALGTRRRNGSDDLAYAKKACVWLKSALREAGIGAKTVAGYGYWQTLNTAKTPESDSIIDESPPSPPPPTSPPTTWRRGKIVKIDTSKTQRGVLEDLETGRRYRFSTKVIKGDMPGKKNPVRYAVEEREGKQMVVEVKKGR